MYPTPIELYPARVKFIYRVVLYSSLAIWVAPLVAILMTAIRSQADLLVGNYWGYPKNLSLINNLKEVFASSPMGMFFMNSVLITCITVIGVLLLSTLAAVALAKYRFPGRTLLFAMFIAGNFVPYQILMIPVRDLVLKIGAYDTIWAMVMFHTAFQTGFATLFMRNFIVSLPDELFEAARLDGANEFQLLMRVIVPLLRPAFAGLSVLLFTFVWNDYFWALVLVQSDAAKPLTLGLAGLKGEWLTAWNLISTGAILAALPPVTIFFLMQKHFIAGLTVGAVKS